MLQRAEQTSSFKLLSYATLVGGASFLPHPVAADAFQLRSLNSDLIEGYTMLGLGCISMYLCYKAWRRSRHRWLVLLYAVILAPFAFSLPASLAFIWIAYATCHYTGPMP